MSEINLNLKQEYEKRLEEQNIKMLETQEIANISCWEYDFAEDKVYINSFPDDSILNINQQSLNKIMDIFHEVDRDTFKKVLDDALSTKKCYLSTDFRVNRNDTFEWINIRAKINYDSQGQPVKAQGVMSNINEEKLIVDRYFQTQKMEAIQRLAGKIARDFNNMLQTIIGYGELIESNIETTGKSATYIAKILESAKRSENVIMQLYSFSGKQNMKLVDFDIYTFFTGLVNELNSSLDDDICIEFHSNISSRSILADKSQLEQIIVNLCNNSIEAMNNSGKIKIYLDTISFRLLDKLKVIPIVHKHIASDYVKISIVDTGCGISPEDYSKIFDPYYSTKAAGSGAGLGLSLVYTIVEAHAGFIDVSSVLGQGTQLDIYLPASDYLDKERSYIHG